MSNRNIANKNTQTDEVILTKVTEKYLNSDFNGSPASGFLSDTLTFAELKKHLIKLILQDKISLCFSGNFHIKAFDSPEKKEQIANLNRITTLESKEISNVGGFSVVSCENDFGIYPSRNHLEKYIDENEFIDQPFKLKLALGEGWMTPYFFELGILSFYRSDPRYRYKTDHIWGSLYTEKDDLLKRKSDHIVLEHFGFGLTSNLSERVVAVFLYDLTKLPPEHQQIWNAKLLDSGFKSKYKVHPDYLKSSLGSWDINSSIFQATYEEIAIINQMTEMIFGVKLFKNEFEDDKPERFGFILLPTEREINDFYLTCNQVIIDNFDRDFFVKNLNLSDFPEIASIQDDELRSREFDKKINQTITSLETFLAKNISFPDPCPKNDMIKFFRKLNELRSKGAHGYRPDKWDNKLFKEQRLFVFKLYSSVRCLRLIFSNHPLVKDIKVPEWLDQGQISTF